MISDKLESVVEKLRSENFSNTIEVDGTNYYEIYFIDESGYKVALEIPVIAKNKNFTLQEHIEICDIAEKTTINVVMNKTKPLSFEDFKFILLKCKIAGGLVKEEDFESFDSYVGKFGDEIYSIIQSFLIITTFNKKKKTKKKE